MSIRIVYRNNLFYYLFMPGIWFSGALIYLGLAKVYAFYIVVKLLVICGAHSDLKWDRPLYRIAWLSPIMWVLERVISSPSSGDTTRSGPVAPISASGLPMSGRSTAHPTK